MPGTYNPNGYGQQPYANNPARNQSYTYIPPKLTPPSIIRAQAPEGQSSASTDRTSPNQMTLNNNLASTPLQIPQPSDLGIQISKTKILNSTSLSWDKIREDLDRMGVTSFRSEKSQSGYIFYCQTATTGTTTRCSAN